MQVLTDVALLSEAPKADILLLRRTGKNWNAAQRQWLADGLRHTEAEHLLVEFKYSQGLTLDAVQQLIAYDYFYCQTAGIVKSDVACFLISASTPKGNWQSQLEFIATAWPGVYQGNNVLLQRMRILLLNELANTPYNAPIKYFATKRNERDKALTTLLSSGFIHLSQQIYSIIVGLRRTYMSNIVMPRELTPEVIMELGHELMNAMLDAAPLHEILKRHKPDEILNHYKPDEVLNHYKPEERLTGLTEKQIRAYLEKLEQSKH